MAAETSKEISTVHIDGKSYDFEALSQDCKQTIAKMTNIDGEIANLALEMEKSQIYREHQFLLLKQQLPSKSLESSEKSEPPAKKGKND